MAKTKKHVGDVLGLSRSTVKAPVKSGTKGRRPKGIELTTARPTSKRAGVVGGVRGRGR